MPNFAEQSPRRTVHQSLTGFGENNQRWHETNPQKGNYTFVADEYETNPLVNDCLKSERFNSFVDNIKKREGYGFHVSDQATNSGISQGWYDNFLADKKNQTFVNNYPSKVKNLTQEQVDNLYCQGFYKPGRIEAINSSPFAEHVFDTVVNPGTGSGPKLVQESINNVTGWNIGTKNGIGTETLSAINNLNNNQLQTVNDNLVDRRKQYYKERSKDKFKRGLLNRAEQFRW